ncbi:MAG TPA: DNA-binding domain-containing protein [Steroidobacteraceae bacterium]|nr:DNA-binding domain-containing protein [Steroidobacteraceae bacterium]
MGLSDLQQAFQSYLVRGDDAIAQQVIGTARVSAPVRLAIYGDGYRSRLIEALEANFPVLAALLGETDFEALGAAYVRTHDPVSYSVRYYGAELAEFLAADERYASAPVLADLARWEWAMAAVFDAADAPAIDATALATVAPEDWAQLRFGLSPSVELLELEWNAPDLWKAVTNETEPPDSQLLPEPATWLLWRDELQIFFRPLAQPESVALAAVKSHRSFGELCLLLSEHIGEDAAAATAAGYLREWLQSGLIAGVDLQ